MDFGGSPWALDEERRRRYLEVLQGLLDYARRFQYTGYNKHDGLNSPLLSAVLGFGRWPRIVAIQLVMRSPWNIRPLLGVPRTRNPKGWGLFSQAWIDLHLASGDELALQEACRLLDGLLAEPSKGFKGLSWGYPYPWQDVGFFAPRHFSNRVVTSWIGFAFARAVAVTGEERYLKALDGIAEFLLGEPRVLADDDEHLCFTYVPDPRVSVAVVDVPALTGAFLAEAGKLLEREDLLADARRLMNWVADKQTNYGAWFYTHPRSDSLITHDNYHTAIILDCFDRYMEASGDTSFESVYREGLEFYSEHHFLEDGAPRWMHDGVRGQDHPFDIHGCGSAILCFSRAARRDHRYWPLALRTLDWTLDNMYDPRGFFYYQKTRFWTKRFCLLRWANGWMGWALAQVLRMSGQNLDGDGAEASCS